VDPLDVLVLENDPKYPSGPWTGFFLQWWMPGRYMMEVDVTFAGGQLQARGLDAVGSFNFQGHYDPVGGQCQWVKDYTGRHQVTYNGLNESQGIWGVWEIRQFGGLYKDRGVFHIWPRGMTPTKAAEATVQAYLAHLRSRWLLRLLAIALGSGLVLAIFLLLQHVSRLWTGGSAP
jgi:hypothetical protein